MKKLSILLIGLLLVAGFAAAEVTLSLSGTSTLTWGLQGQLIDNSATFGSVNVNDFAYTDDSGKHVFSPNEVKLTMEAADEDGMVIVKAESSFKFDDVLWTNTDNGNYQDAFSFIEFPNVVPGVLGVKLNKAGTLSTSVTAVKSVSSEPWVLLTATPVEGLKAQLGVLFEQFGLDRVGTITVVYDTYIDFAASVYAEYVATLSEEDSVTVAFGTIFDTAYSNTVYNVVNGSVTDEMYGPYSIIATTAVPAAGNEVYGFETLPIGLGIDAVVAGITAGVDFQTRLVQGADVEDIDATGAIRATYALPIYAALNVAYEMEMGDMTITPNANFKYSSDFWKWDVNADNDGFEYVGNVTAAEFLGRPMSAGVGVKVAGIAGMLDVNLTGSAGFGDGEFAHGLDYFGLGQAVTLAKLLTDTATANPDTASTNDGFFADSSALVMKGSLGLTAKPVDGWTITNTTAYTVDNLGFVGFADDTPPVLWGDYLSRIDNDTKVTWDLMVGDAAVATFFGELNLDVVNYVMEAGQTLSTADVVTDTEQTGKTTLGWKAGVQVKVSTP